VDIIRVMGLRVNKGTSRPNWEPVSARVCRNSSRSESERKIARRSLPRAMT